MNKLRGIVRNLDSLGRVVIPKEWRNALGLNYGAPVEMIIDGDQVIFRKTANGCVICGDTDIKVAGIHEKNICRDCTIQIINANISADLVAAGQ